MTSISTLAKECSGLFSRWHAAITNNSEKLAKVENRLFRFNLWAENNAALSDGRDSMDWRLRKASVPHSVITDLLEDLAADITRSLTSIDKDYQADPEDDTTDSEDVILDRLFRFSRAIRRSGILRRFVKVANHFDYDPNTGENLTVKFQEGIMPYLDRALKKTSQDLKDRLCETICLRQQNFSYLGSRRESKLRSGREIISEPAQPILQTGSRLGTGYSFKSRRIDQSKRPPEPSQRRTAGGQPSVRSATTLNTNAAPAVNQVLEQTTVEHIAADLPRRPKVPLGRTELECPYCFLACSARDFTKTGWPRHIVQDLMPFVCVLEPCQTPNAMYDSHTAWMSHMKTEHARYGWTCMDSSHSSSLHFEEEQNFRRHVLNAHGDDLTQGELDDVIDECHGPLPTLEFFKDCPFCDEFDASALESHGMEHHIAKHLLFLSQVSLSGHDLYLKDVKFESESGNSSSGGRLDSDNSNASGASSISNPRLLKTVEDAIRRLILPELDSLKRKQKEGGGVSENDESPLSSPGSTVLLSPTDAPDLRLSDGIIEPPELPLEPDQPDIWDTIMVRDTVQKLKGIPIYDPEADKVIQNLRLQQEKADVNAAAATTTEGRTELQPEADGGHLPTVEQLEAALVGGAKEVVQIPLDAGVNVNMEEGEYATALYVASARGDENEVQKLVNIGANVDIGGEYANALYVASARGHERVVQILVDARANLNRKGGEYNTALQAASVRGHEKVVQILIDRGVDVNMQGGYHGNALQAASVRGHEKVVQILVNAGATINMAGRYPNALYAASVRGHEKVVQVLVDEGADVDTEGGEYNNALQAASGRGYEKVVQILLERGADVNAQGGFYGNALQAASEGGHEKIVKMLLERGADVNAHGGFYGNALRAALEGGHEKVVQILLSVGAADTNAQGEFHGKATSKDGHEEMVQILHDKISIR